MKRFFPRIWRQKKNKTIAKRDDSLEREYAQYKAYMEE